MPYALKEKQREAQRNWASDVRYIDYTAAKMALDRRKESPELIQSYFEFSNFENPKRSAESMFRYFRTMKKHFLKYKTKGLNAEQIAEIRAEMKELIKLLN